jgi:hypothetical protein
MGVISRVPVICKIRMLAAHAVNHDSSTSSMFSTTRKILNSLSILPDAQGRVLAELPDPSHFLNLSILDNRLLLPTDSELAEMIGPDGIKIRGGKVLHSTEAVLAVLHKREPLLLISGGSDSTRETDQLPPGSIVNFIPAFGRVNFPAAVDAVNIYAAMLKSQGFEKLSGGE